MTLLIVEQLLVAFVVTAAAKYMISRIFILRNEIEKNPVWQLKNPVSEEMRQIYREIDQDILITDPDLLTPEKPKTLDDCVRDHVSEEVVQAWANIIYSTGRKGPLKEAEWPRVEITVRKKGDTYDLIFPENIRFPRWNQTPALTLFAFYSGPDKQKDTQHVAVLDKGSAMPVMPNDQLIINSVITRSSKEMM